MSTTCQCDTSCTPKCPSGMCPQCLKKGEKLPEPQRPVKCYKVIDLPNVTGPGWIKTAVEVDSAQCASSLGNPLAAYMDDGTQLNNYEQDPDNYYGPELKATCPTVPTCTVPVWGVGDWTAAAAAKARAQARARMMMRYAPSYYY